MPAGAIIGGAATLIGAGINYLGNENAANTQSQTAANALTFAKQQEAQKEAYQNQQNQLALWQQQEQNARLAPYQAARAAVLKSFGINAPTNNVPMPPGLLNAVGGAPLSAGGVIGSNPLLGAGSSTPGSYAPAIGAGAIGLGGIGYALANRPGTPEMGGPPSNQITSTPPEMGGPPGSQITTPGNNPMTNWVAQNLGYQPSSFSSTPVDASVPNDLSGGAGGP